MWTGSTSSRASVDLDGKVTSATSVSITPTPALDLEPGYLAVGASAVTAEVPTARYPGLGSEVSCSLCLLLQIMMIVPLTLVSMEECVLIRWRTSSASVLVAGRGSDAISVSVDPGQSLFFIIIIRNSAMVFAQPQLGNNNPI